MLKPATEVDNEDVTPPENVAVIVLGTLIMTIPDPPLPPEVVVAKKAVPLPAPPPPPVLVVPAVPLATPPGPLAPPAPPPSVALPAPALYPPPPPPPARPTLDPEILDVVPAPPLEPAPVDVFAPTALAPPPPAEPFPVDDPPLFPCDGDVDGVLPEPPVPPLEAPPPEPPLLPLPDEYVPPGKKMPSPYPQQQALELAQQRAAKVDQSLESYPRSLQQGYEHDWYHGSTGDIKNFNQSLLGEATGAASAKKGFFFARDPQNPPASMLQKSTNQESIEMLKKMGMSDDEITKLNTVSMAGHGPETASGYAQIGGSREYRDAMRKANSAEKRGDWGEYEKQMQIAEDSEINRMNYAQSMVAKYGDARDEMLETIKNTIYNKKLSQEEANALDKKYMELMPYGWYNSFEPKQFNQLKKQLVNLVGQDAATPALSQIDNFKSIKAERMAVENTQQGGNVMPVALRYENPMVYDFQGSAYRDQTYSDLIDQALSGGHDALILKNTFDPGGGPAKLVDVGVVFDPSQIRSRFAAFDPFRKDVATATAMGVALPDLLAAEPTPQPQSSGLLYPFP